MFEVKIILDSITPFGNRLTTITSTFPRYILAQVNTHRDRARNAASSRAIPFPVMTGNIVADPFIPIEWGIEKSGMQPGDEIPKKMRPLAKEIWLEAMSDSMRHAMRLHHIGKTYVEMYPDDTEDGDTEVRIHKSIPNRLNEPWMWCTQVMTATEWNNFFRLRCHPHAEVHFQKIATMIRNAMIANTPRLLKTGEWHMPFVAENDYENLIEEGFSRNDICKISVSRCARVSYLTHEGKRDPRLDLQLFERLVTGSGFGHWSAHEHVACSGGMDVRSGPFRGWEQYRKSFVNENVSG